MSIDAPAFEDVPADQRTAAGLAEWTGRQISTGALLAGTRLAPIRAVARLLDISPTTVTEAWRILQSYGAITTDGRRGTFVRGPRQGIAAGRYWQVPAPPGTLDLDLSTGVPDPHLVPPLGPILSQVHDRVPITSYLDDTVLPELEVELRREWPFEPEAITIVDGAQDALDRLIRELVNVGDRVLVEELTFPPILDMLDEAGAQVIGVPLDDDGLVVSALTTALALDPVALILQPRAHNPTGIAMSALRADEIASVMSGSGTLVIEDDHCRGVAGADLMSLGARLPGQVVHISSFSKSHNPDLRLAALGGAAEPIRRVVQRRRLGPSWSSRLLQLVLLEMLRDETTIAMVSAAERSYTQRRSGLVAALNRHGVRSIGASGINVWVEVADEQVALLSLAAQGIGAAPGTPFAIGPDGVPHLRVSVSGVTNDIDGLAAAIAAAAHPHRSGTAT